MFKIGDLVICHGWQEPLLYLVCDDECAQPPETLGILTPGDGAVCDTLVTDIFQEEE